MPIFSWSVDKPRPGLAILRLDGEMTLGAREAMREAFDALANAPETACAVDFTLVRLVSSGAIGELVRSHSRIVGIGRAMYLVCPSGDVMETLLVADMHRLIPLYPDTQSLLKGILP